MFPQLPASVRIYLCTKPTDLRKGFDGLQGMVRDFVGQDPLSGHLFLFLNRRRDRVKVLLWDRDGFVIWYKRLEAGTFQQFDPTHVHKPRLRRGRHRADDNGPGSAAHRSRLGLRSKAQALCSRQLIRFQGIPEKNLAKSCPNAQSDTYM